MTWDAGWGSFHLNNAWGTASIQVFFGILLAGGLWDDAALLKSLGFLCSPQAVELGKAPGVSGGSRAGLSPGKESPMDVEGRDGQRCLWSKSQNSLGWKDLKAPLVPWAGMPCTKACSKPYPTPEQGVRLARSSSLKWESTKSPRCGFKDGVFQHEDESQDCWISSPCAPGAVRNS